MELRLYIDTLVSSLLTKVNGVGGIPFLILPEPFSLLHLSVFYIILFYIPESLFGVVSFFYSFNRSIVFGSSWNKFSSYIQHYPFPLKENSA